MTGDPSPWKDLHKLDTSGITVNLIDVDGPEDVGSTLELSDYNTIQSQSSLLDVDFLLPGGGGRLPGQAFPIKKVPSNENPGESYDICDDCNASDRSLNYCNGCNFVFCPGCWDRQLVHKRGRLSPGGVPHEKSNASIARKVLRILNPPSEPSLRQKLHFDDSKTAWFGIQRPDFGRPVFQDYGRFADLMRSTKRLSAAAGGFHRQTPECQLSNDQRTPSLVSFIGETGHGKSTLVKLLVELQTVGSDGGEHPTPVVGQPGVLDPTSADVHLYSDPSTAQDDNPILFADCEGLTGGSRPPISAVMKKRFGTFGSGDDNASSHAIPLSSREITWDCSSREAAVANLYPRLLYTFSDVVVFVLKNHRVVENVLEKLVGWAASAIETSSNQPLLPHAILALNAEDYNINESLWDMKAATTDMLKSLEKTVDQNETFKQAAQYWRERDRQIETVEQLMLCYYSSIQVIRIPRQRRPRLVHQQIGNLYNAIREACLAARLQKEELRMLLEVQELQCYLDQAFDHFARVVDKPFDFVHASRLHSPIPLDFGGNILKLALKVMETWQDKAKPKHVFDELSYVVASAIMFDVARTKKRGRIDAIFPQYIEQLDSALETFCNSHWPCEYVTDSGARCINVRNGHSKGHQTRNGRVLAAGDYASRFSFQGYRQSFNTGVYFVLQQLLEYLELEKKFGKEEKEAAARIHQHTLSNFYRRCGCVREDPGPNLISHSACFCCLFEIPEHSLPCGHTFCTSCVKAYGSASGKSELTIQACPLCSSDDNPVWSHKIAFKPETAGVRILSLDGGGIRGIIELEVLWQIEQALGGKLPIQRFFDLIVGTSTGGLIALGLAAKEWTVKDCITRFETLCNKAFTRRTGGGLPLVGLVIENHHQSKFETTRLQEALMEAFGKEDYLFGGSRAAHQSSSVKVAVTTTSAATGIPVVVSNYNRPNSGKLSYHFQRPDDLPSELKIWEAARSTSAAPRYFKSFEHSPSQQVYLDGAIYHNNPIAIAERERRLIWPARPAEPPDVVLSIGTGASRNMHHKESPVSPSVGYGGMMDYPKRLFKILRGVLNTSLDCERIWNEFLTGLPNSSEDSRFIRINPELKGDVPQLDAVEQMKPLQNLVRNEALSPDAGLRYRRIAMRLVATCFYFELHDEMGQNNVARGDIRCRFEDGSNELCELGFLLASWTYQTKRPPVFTIQEQNSGVASIEMTVTEQVIERMIKQSHFAVSTICLQLTSKWATLKMHLDLGEWEIYPLSGFPRPLVDEQKVSRSSTVHGSRRRRLTYERKPAEWKPPMAAAQQHESLASYWHTKPVIGTQAEEDDIERQEQPISSPHDYLRKAQRLLRHMIHRKSTAVSEPQATSSTLEPSVVSGYYEAPTTPLRRAAEESRACCEWCAEDLEAPVQPVELEVPSTTIPELDSSSLERTPRSAPSELPPNWPLGSGTGPTRRRGLDYAEDLFNGPGLPTRSLTVRPVQPEPASPSSYDRSSRTWSSSDSNYPPGTCF